MKISNNICSNFPTFSFTKFVMKLNSTRQKFRKGGFMSRVLPTKMFLNSSQKKNQMKNTRSLNWSAKRKF
jgi:hypothetical protein